MPLNVLLPMVVIGIVAIAVILHMLGLSRRTVMSDSNQACIAWDDEFDEDPAQDAVLCHDGHAALITARSGRHGIVFAMGADTTARYLDGARLGATATGLRVDLPDFTAPHIHLTLDAGEAARWAALIGETA